MSSTKLRREYFDDPLARGYAAMTSVQVRTSLLDASLRPVADRKLLPAPELCDVIVRAEFKALPADERDEIEVILRIQGDIFVGSESAARATLMAIFPDGTATQSNLLALLTGVTQSRAQELGLNPELSASDVTAARLPDQPLGPPVLNP